MKPFFITCLLLSNFIFADYSQHQEAQEVIELLVSEHDFDKSYVEAILRSANKQEKILQSMSKPAEFTWTWERYRKLFLEDKRIANGKKFIQDNSELFDRVENEFGVPREIITSILGVETRYGKIQGNYRVLDSLVTLGFDFPRRSKFFKSELIQFFLLSFHQCLEHQGLHMLQEKYS